MIVTLFRIGLVREGRDGFVWLELDEFRIRLG